MRRGISILGLAVGVLGCSPSSTSTRAASSRAPDDSATPARGSRELGEALAGRPALVSFWATWCDACAAEFGALNRLDAEARRRRGVVIGIAVGESPDKVADFVRGRGLRYAQIVDEDFKLADALGERRVPATLVIDRAGRIVFRGGSLDEQALHAFEIAEDEATP